MYFLIFAFLKLEAVASVLANQNNKPLNFLKNEFRHKSTF